MKILEVGDEVCLENRSTGSPVTTFRFSKIARLTETLAVLENNVRLIKKPVGHRYREYGRKFNKWQLTTPEDHLRAKKEVKKEAAVIWFSKKKFTAEEMLEIYQHFSGHDKTWNATP